MPINKLLQFECQMASISSRVWILDFQLVAQSGEVGEPLGWRPSEQQRAAEKGLVGGGGYLVSGEALCFLAIEM